MNASETKNIQCTRCLKLVIYIGIIEAVVFMVLKVALGLSTGSRALAAASLYSLQALIASIVVAVGLNISAKPPDRKYPYGHGKVEFVIVALISLVILLGIIALSITALSGIFGSPRTSEPPNLLALWFALICGVCCWILSRYTKCVAVHLKSPALHSCSEHVHSDFLASMAVVVSVIGAELGFAALDHIIAIIEAIHVVFVSGRMLGTAASGLMDSSVEPYLIEKLKRAVGAVEAVVRVRSVTGRWSGQTMLAEVSVEVPGRMKVAAAEKVRARIEEVVRVQGSGNSRTQVRILPLE